MDNEKLEGKLRAIQDLKSDHYIGTQEALRYVNQVSGIFQNPVPYRISQSINDRLTSENPRVTYKATPERVVGLLKTVDDRLDEIQDIQREKLKELIGEEPSIHEEGEDKWLAAITNIDWHYSEESDCNVFNWESIMTWEVPDESPANDIAQKLYFAQHGKFAPKMNLSEDERNLGNFLYEVFEGVQDPSNPEMLKYIEENGRNSLFGLYGSGLIIAPFMTEEMLEEFNAPIDWDNNLSGKTFQDWESQQRRASYVSQVDQKKVIDRIIRDQVDHRLENRRMVLCDWLDRHEITSFDEALQKAKQHAIEYKKILDEHVQHGLQAQGMKRGLKQSRFVLQLVSSERNFVRKYLEA